MNDEVPPPIPPQPQPGLPPQPPPPVMMAPRWIGWVAASVLLPALPWLAFDDKANDAGTLVMVLTLLALVVQLIASAVVAVGFCKKRFIGIGGVIGMTVVFMLASVSIGTAIWFSSCLARITLDYK